MIIIKPKYIPEAQVLDRSVVVYDSFSLVDCRDLVVVKIIVSSNLLILNNGHSDVLVKIEVEIVENLSQLDHERLHGFVNKLFIKSIMIQICFGNLWDRGFRDVLGHVFDRLLFQNSLCVKTVQSNVLFLGQLPLFLSLPF